MEVKIEKDDSLCKLRVKKAKIEDHDGLWDVEITGKCNEEVRYSLRDLTMLISEKLYYILLLFIGPPKRTRWP